MGLVTALALGATAVGGALSARSQSKAAGKAANVAQNTADQNNALTRDIYNQNQQTLAPYVQAGLPATQALNSFYGLTQPGQQQLPAQQPNAMSQFQPAGMGQGMMYEGFDGPMGGYGMREFAGRGYNGEPTGGFAMMGGQQPQQQPQMNQLAQPAQNAGDPFKQYIANSDYAFQFGEGANRVNSGYAGAGTLQSGAAMKALEGYRQNLQSGYRDQWAQGVANQQGVGLAGASALAGVGQNYVNTVSANNNNAGSAAANALLMKGQNNPLAAGLGAAGGAYVGLFGGKK